MTDNHVPDGERSESTSPTLLDRVRARDATAWCSLVRMYSPLIYHWCRRSGLQPSDAADVGQEVFRSVFSAVGRFHRTGDGSFRGWLRAITRNKVRDFARDRTKNPGGGDAAGLLAAVPAPDPDDTPDPEEERILYRQALGIVLADYREESREAFLRVVIDRQDPAAVAADLGLTVNAVYLMKSRVLRRLREEFADLLDPNAGPPPPTAPEAP